MKEPLLPADQVRQQVRARYGAIALQAESGCGCGCGCAIPPQVLGYRPEDLAVAPPGAEMGLGCGNPTALAAVQPGQTVLDLGCGGGFDCFVIARKTGPTGRVIGVDMTPEMIARARANAAQAGAGNVEFRLGEIEHLPVADASVDWIISNCVINLSPNKAQVLAEAFRVLRPGGGLAITDIVAVQPMPEKLKTDWAALTGCVAGAATVAEWTTLLQRAGFVEIQIELKPNSRELLNHWMPGAGEVAASASITARKPVA
ncbi:MAG: arsenite methyltransferase [Verrucomicrobiae bacterium]|nr:arsenite methyltransferase [Verrucomicrobiae bacterium]